MQLRYGHGDTTEVPLIMKSQRKRLIFGFVTLALILPLHGETAVTALRRHVAYSFTIQNTKGNALSLAELWVSGPVALTSAQVCDKIKASYPHRVIRDDLGNQALYFAFTNLPPYGVKVIGIEADIELIKPLVESAQTSETNLMVWLKPERFVEIDNPDFLRSAPSFRGSNSLAEAKMICQWVHQNVMYDRYSARDRGALYAIREKKGDCTEFMYLFVALCRREGIPARGVGGYMCSENTILKPTGYHNWAEFYDGEQWLLADPYRGLFAPEPGEYVATRILGVSDSPMGDFPRYRFKGDGLEVEMN